MRKLKCARCGEVKSLADQDPTRRHCAYCIMRWLTARVAKKLEAKYEDDIDILQAERNDLQDQVDQLNKQISQYEIPDHDCKSGGQIGNHVCYDDDKE